jgi:hypothetical protein
MCDSDGAEKTSDGDERLEHHRHHLWIVQIQHPSLLVLEDALEQDLVGGAVGQVGIVAVTSARARSDAGRGHSGT